MKSNNKNNKIKTQDQIKRWYFLVFKNCQTAFLRYGKREECQEKGCWVYYDSYADFKKQQKRTRFISFSGAGVILAVVIVGLCINLAFPVIFRSDASVGNFWKQVSEKDFATDEVNTNIAVEKGIKLIGKDKILTFEKADDYFGGRSWSYDGQEMTSLSGVVLGELKLNQGYNINTETLLKLPSNKLMNVWYDNADGNEYLSTLGGFVIINTNKTKTSLDDKVILSLKQNDKNGLSSNYTYHSWLDNKTKYLYISTGSGLDVYDIASGVEKIKKVFTYSSSSTPAIAYNKVKNSFLSDGVLYISTDGGGLSMIDTKNTTDTGDDLLIGTYDKKSQLKLDNDRIFVTRKLNNLLYIGTWGNGIKIIDTKGTLSLEDDIIVKSQVEAGRVYDILPIQDGVFVALGQMGLVFINNNFEIKRYLIEEDVSSLDYDQVEQMLTVGVNGNGIYGFTFENSDLSQVYNYNINTSPVLGSNNVTSVYSDKKSDQIFVGSEDAGLMVLTLGEFSAQGIFEGRPQSIAGNIPVGVSWSGDQTASTSAYLQVRTGEEGTIWKMPVDQGGVELVKDLWGGMFAKTEMNKGVLTLSGRDNMKQGASFSISENGYDFVAKSKIRVRIRVNSDARGLRSVVFVDDWKGSGFVLSKTKDWQDVTFESDVNFSSIGMSITWNDGWEDGDSIEISDLIVEGPDMWDSWSSPLKNSKYSNIPIDKRSGWWQYRVVLNTVDQKISPKVSNIIFWSNYSSAGEYISPVVDTGVPVEWGMFDAEINKPNGTNILFFVRNKNSYQDSWSSWQLTENKDKILLLPSRYIQYKAQLYTNNRSISPDVSSISINYFKTTSVK